MTILGKTALVLSLLWLAGCPLEDWFGGEGEVTVLLTDAPVDRVASLRLTVTGVELLHGSRGAELFEFEDPVVVENLLDLQGGATRALISAETVPTGDYEGIRLRLSGAADDAVVVEEAGGEFPLLFGEARETGLPGDVVVELGGEFDVDEEELATLIVDVDLRRSLVKEDPGTYYRLWPAFQLLVREDTGAVSGTVAASLLQAADCTADLALDRGNAIYFFGDTTTPGSDVFVDARGTALDAGNPVAVVPVVLDGAGTYVFNAPFLPEGSYRAALTCQALDDDPRVDEGLAFVGEREVFVEAGAGRTVDFVP